MIFKVNVLTKLFDLQLVLVQIALVLGGKLSPEILGSMNSDICSQNQNNIYEVSGQQDLSEVFNKEGR